ncbi:hypothetical protein P3X46_012262 [Hevea brasiliensis]|uniref:Reverse transcriptase domain-containing protein n=1 Tax=Hevea brasiliensis TaxID=3981 RepID=A0ABQ9MDB8_HEVBR|nr:hypothetical protein P3X46_012262 [Hevea brasiliensis]
MNIDECGTHRKLQLQELKAIRNDANENMTIYKVRTKAFHNRRLRLKEFKVGERVLLYNSRLRLFLGKLHSRWLGPYIITNVYDYGVVEIKSEATKKIFKVNGHRLKPYYEKFQEQKSDEVILEIPS